MANLQEDISLTMTKEGDGEEISNQTPNNQFIFGLMGWQCHSKAPSGFRIFVCPSCVPFLGLYVSVLIVR